MIRAGGAVDLPVLVKFFTIFSVGKKASRRAEGVVEYRHFDDSDRIHA